MAQQQKDNSHINKQNISLSNTVSHIDSKNIGILETGLHAETFEEFLETFGDNKTATTDILSRVMSKNKINTNTLSEMKIDINNILKYSDNDQLNTEIQEVISREFLEKLWHAGRLNIQFREIFEGNFGSIKKLKNKKLLFKDIQTSIDELMEKFPDITNNITVSNNNIFDGLNQKGFNINTIASFNKQTPSDKMILANLVYFETHDAIENMKKGKTDLEKEMNGLLSPDQSPVNTIQKYMDIADEEHNKFNKNKYKKGYKYPENYQRLIDGNEENNAKRNKLEDKLAESKYQDNTILKEIHDSNRIEWDNYIEYFESIEGLGQSESENKTYIDILKKLVKNNFNFNELSDSEQDTLVQQTMKQNINNLTENNWTVGFGIDHDEYRHFLEQVMGFKNKQENVIIPLPNGDEIKFKITKKFEEGEHLNLLDFSNFKDVRNLPITYDIEFDIDEDDMVDLNQILRREKDNRDKTIILHGNDINKINQLYVLSMAQSDTYKDIEDGAQSQEINKLTDGLTKNILEYRGKEEGIVDAEELFQYMSEFGAYESDQSEMFDMAREKFDKLDKDGQIAFKTRLEELGNNSDTPEVQTAVAEIISDIENNTNNIDGTTGNEGVKDKIETEEEKFMKSREKLSGNSFEGVKNKGFCKGTRLFINIGGSKLPPEDMGDSFFEIEILDTKSSETKFQVNIIGSDIKSSMDGKTVRFPKTDEQLSLMKSSGKIFKVAKGNTKDWDKSIDNINASNIIKKMTVFGTGDGQVIMKDGKFVNHEGEEIKHFSRAMDEYVGGEGQVKEYITYSIKKINKSKGTVHVLCDFDGQDPDDMSKQVKFKYDKELSYEQFILLMESKKTRGYTKEQTDEITSIKGPAGRLPNKGILTFYSLGSIFNSVKNGAKKIKEKVTKVNEDEIADFENLLYSDEGLNLYGKIGSIFEALKIFPGISDAFKSAELEFYGERESMTRKKIEHWYKIFEADPHFPTLRYKTLSKLLEKPGYVGNDKNRHQVAAAFLILMKKDGPYGRGKLLQHMGKGYWVEKFLGPEHKNRFKLFFEDRKKQLEEYGDINHIHWRKTRQDELNRLEFDYMVGVIDGRQPFGGLPGDDEHAQASKRSRDFATTLDENSKSYFNSFKEKADKLGPISFRQAEQEYFRMVTTGRFHKALPFLKRMAEDAQNQSEENRVKMNILGAMLTGLFKNAQNQDVMSEFWKISRTIGFLPGIWARDNDQQDKVQKLLDGITSKSPFEQFSKGAKYKKSDFEPGNFSKDQLKLSFLSKDLPQYWSKYGNKILDILEFRDMESETSIGNLANNKGPNAYVFQDIINLSRESTKEDIDKNTSYTYGYYVRSPRTANKGIVADLVPRNGDYKGKETIEIEAAEEFWKSVSSKLDTHKRSKESDVEFYLGKFYNWFDGDVRDQSSIKFLMRGLSLVKELKLSGHTKEAEYQLWYLIKGSIYDKIGSMPPEFGASIDKFVSFFWNNVEHINSKMVNNTFGGDAAMAFDDSYGMLDWNGFWNNYMVFDGFGGGRQKSDYSKKYKIYEENYINWEIDRMKKNLKRKGITGMPTEPHNSHVIVEHEKGYENQFLQAA